MHRIALGLCVVASLSACKKNEEAVAKAPPAAPLKLELAVTTEAPAPKQIVLTGIVKADQRLEVTADTAGKVLGVMVDRGQRVKQGQELVRLDVRTQALGAREAQANVASARAQRQLAEEECKRAQSLLDKGAITRSEYDRQSTQCTSALQQVAAAEARAGMMAKSLQDGVVRAPFDGVISDKNVTAGDWVQPGRPLFTLVDDDPLKIELSVPEAAVRAVQKDQKVEIEAVAQPGKTYTATVTRLGAEIGRSRSLIVEATLEKSDLVPGMFAEARLTVGQETRPVVPETAVVKRGKTWHAFVVVKGEAQDRIVQLGSKPAAGQVSIVQGLVKGDRVVAKVTELVVDGVRVVE
ncbi:MAG: efflux RND transporter periplasmic adaptor subunit [Myxococcota bacterium]|nr:efflux RND transporter periplasmic adaptor subunit [Myxococcota bacterium]